MSNLFSALDTGLSALFTSQTALSAIGHNITNVNTFGYSRQEVGLQARLPTNFAEGVLGSGVEIEQIKRVYDRFLGDQLVRQQERVGSTEQKLVAWEQIESNLNDLSETGLKDSISTFFSAWHDLASAPENTAFRNNVMRRAESLAASFRDTQSRLNGLLRDTDTTVSLEVDSINSITAEIAKLNVMIAQQETSGTPANDFRDQRDVLVQELSRHVAIDSFEDNNGMLFVEVRGAGGPLVIANQTQELVAFRDPANNNLYDVRLDVNGNLIDLTDFIEGGTLQGALYSRDTTLQNEMAKLDELANGIIDQVNALHTTGFDLNGNNLAQDFFIPGTGATLMAVDPAIVADVRLIAASGTGAPGDNSIANSIAGLQQALTMNGASDTFDEYYNSMVVEIGNEIIGLNSKRETDDAVLYQLENRRDSLSGVSLDEEAADLMRYQKMYQAASKYISVIDGLMGTLISELGR
ncbi:MAG: flagellar hook-associated protein FlgK [Candidatus Schekmanbacteria bacterium]|nr:flagellar hook-associated protein FlgK [Candidatus Schekmanbacteria bacterium]